MVSTSLMVLLWLLFYISFVYGKADEFGAFEVAVRTIRQCHGPKRKNCCKIAINLTNNRASYDFQVIENAFVTKAKITVAGNNKAPVRLQMNKPCEHLFVKPIMKLYFNMSDNCIVPKGKYHFFYDLEEAFATYYHGMFIGNWTFKAIMFGDECNFLCSEGKYHILYDFEDVMKTYYRGMFIYGNWTFKTTMFGDECNFLCTEMDVELNPKKK